MARGWIDSDADVAVRPKRPRWMPAAWCAVGVLTLLSAVSMRWGSPYLLKLRFVILGLILACMGGVVFRRGVAARATARVVAWLVAFRFRDAVLLAVLVVLAALGIHRFVFEGIPHVPDEFAYLFQAQTYAAGRLYRAAPPVPEAFTFGYQWIVVHEGRWFSVFPPGWPALLAVGVRLGVPFLVNPLIAALGLLAMYRLFRELYGNARAGAACLLMAVSPFFMIMAGAYMSHPATLLLATLTVLWVVRLAHSGGAWYGLAAGLAGGAAFLVRPYEGGLVTAACGMWLMGRRPTWRGLRQAALLAPGLLLGVAVLVLYMRAVMGVWFVLPIDLSFSPPSVNRLGFGPNTGVNWHTFATPGHSAWRALLNASFNVAVLSHDLFGWPGLSLVFFWAALLLGRRDRFRSLSLVIMALIVGLYAHYWYHGVCLGARYYHVLLPFLALFSVEGMARVSAALQRAWPTPDVLHPILRGVLLTLFALALATYWPRVTLATPYRRHRHVWNWPKTELAAAQPGKALVMVHGVRPNAVSPGLMRNAVDLERGDVIVAIGRDRALDARLRAAFPEHEARVVTLTPPEPGRFERALVAVARRLIDTREPYFPRAYTEGPPGPLPVRDEF